MDAFFNFVQFLQFQFIQIGSLAFAMGSSPVLPQLAPCPAGANNHHFPVGICVKLHFGFYLVHVLPTSTPAPGGIPFLHLPGFTSMAMVSSHHFFGVA
jgi:hypothetical protein